MERPARVHQVVGYAPSWKNVHAETVAVAVAEGRGQVRSLGTIPIFDDRAEERAAMTNTDECWIHTRTHIKRLLVVRTTGDASIGPERAESDEARRTMNRMKSVARLEHVLNRLRLSTNPPVIEGVWSSITPL